MYYICIIVKIMLATHYLNDNAFEMNLQEILNKTKRELKIRNYSNKTIKSYIYCIKEYLDYKKIVYEKIDEKNIKNHLLTLQKKITTDY